MKLFISLFISCILLSSCSGSDDSNNNNPNLLDIGINLTLDLNLPEFNQLNFPGNSFVTNVQGIRGIVVYNVDNSQYSAFEISDPNHTPNDCSASSIDGIVATCNCADGNSYNIVTGQQMTGTGGFPLKRYRIEKVGSQLRITN